MPAWDGREAALLTFSTTERWGLYLLASAIPSAGLDHTKIDPGKTDAPTILEKLRQAIVSPAGGNAEGTDSGITIMGELSLLGIHDVAFIVRHTQGAELDLLESAVASIANQITELCGWRNGDRKAVIRAASEFRTAALQHVERLVGDENKWRRIAGLVSPKNMPGKAFLCPPRILNSSCDFLLPLFPPPETPAEFFDPETEVACVSFYRMQPRVLSVRDEAGRIIALCAYKRLSEAAEKLRTDRQRPLLRMLFAGVGCYQVVAFFAGSSMDEISRAKDQLSKELALDAPWPANPRQPGAKPRTLHLVDTSSTLFAVPSESMADQSLERCDVSVLLKIWPGYREDDDTYRYLGKLAEACGIRTTDVRCISETSCVFGERQGHFDAVMTIIRPRTLRPVLRLLDVLGLLVPFVEDTATILRFNSNT